MKLSQSFWRRLAIHSDDCCWQVVGGTAWNGTNRKSPSLACIRILEKKEFGQTCYE